MSRPVRVMLVANDGFSAGHVTRVLAVAAALARRGTARGLTTTLLLATTSEADALLAGEPVALVRLPAPLAGRRAGLSDAERRRLVRGCIEAAIDSFAPDVLVVDTFPSGPHGELAGLVDSHAKRVLLRRHVPLERRGDDALSRGLEGYALAILAADPTPLDESLPMRCVHVPSITRTETDSLATRATARARLGLAEDARIVLITSGGGGDPEAAQRAGRIAGAAVRVDPSPVVALASGPLDAPREHTPTAYSFVASAPKSRVVPISVAPLGPWMAAFDGALSAAGYNTAHELAKAGVPQALFASPRPFDDQAARAKRFAEAGLAKVLEGDDDESVRAALAWMKTAPRPALPSGGADRAADAILALATGSTP